MEMIESALIVLAAYLIGSFPSAYILVRQLKAVDVRAVGSGNVGATNVARVAGLKAGIVVFVLDFAKGAIASGLLPKLMPTASAQLLGWTCASAAVLGHNFPIFLRFKGGKGVATTLGSIMALDPVAALSCVGVWLVGAGISRYVSVGSLAAAIALPVIQVLARRSLPEVYFGAGLALLVVIRHSANIERLTQGRENPMGRKKD